MEKPLIKQTLLIAIPFAGGNSYSFNFMKPLLPPDIILETLEYPGRGKKSIVPLITQMNVLIEDLLNQYQQIVDVVKPDRIIIYGHSIGAVIGVALLHTLNKGNQHIMPEMAIFSGHGGPQLTIKRHLSSIPSQQLIAYFENIGCLSKELVADAELMDYILPILRNDLALYENYRSFYPEKLTLPIAVINGEQDYILKKDINGWRYETTGEMEFHQLAGHHFFMSQYPMAFCSLIVNLITNGIKRQTASLSESGVLID